jgi:dTDP-glucose pyrophosphorylase/CBS domain-containing protein
MSEQENISLTPMPAWQKVLLPQTASVFEAMQVINEVRILRVVFVVDAQNKLVGTITDGDIRRGFLRGLTSTSSAREVMNANPIYIDDSVKDASVKLAMMRAKDIEQLPTINARGEVVSVDTMASLNQQQKRPEEVVLMAGGFGSRLKERTAQTPKPLLSVGGKPILQTILENFIEYGFENFTISLGYKGDKIRSYFGDGSQWGVRIAYVSEDEPLGTAGALSLLTPRPDRTFFVMNGDVLTKVNFRQMLRYHKEHGAQATMCVRSFANEIPYGVVRTDGIDIAGFDEKPVQNMMVNAGVYMLEPEVFAHLPKGRLDMPSLFDALRKASLKTVAFPIHEYWMDVGSPGDFDKADAHYGAVFGT